MKNYKRNHQLLIIMSYGFENSVLGKENWGLCELMACFILLWLHWWMHFWLFILNYWQHNILGAAVSSSHSVALSVSLTVCSPDVLGGGVQTWDLKVAAAACLLLLCLNIFMDLELGCIGVLHGPVLQFPEENNQTAENLEENNAVRSGRCLKYNKFLCANHQASMKFEERMFYSINVKVVSCEG